jgi:hypothetical protein
MEPLILGLPKSRTVTLMLDGGQGTLLTSFHCVLEVRLQDIEIQNFNVKLILGCVKLKV